MPPISQRSVLYAQNFLKNPCLVDHLLDRCNIGACDIVYEIGPGKGIITERLASRCRQVVAIEKDPQLVEVLRHRFAAAPNVTIHESDFLQFRLPTIPYTVFASIPFNITTAIVTKLTMEACPPDDAYLVVQREAAEKFLGKPAESLYAVLMKPWFEPEVVHRFKRSDFVPVPRVDVVMLRLRKRGPPLIKQADRQLFRDFVVYGFTTWQPCLSRIFKGIFTPQQFRQAGRKLGFDIDTTPSSVRFEQWLKLFDYFKCVGDIQTLQTISGSERRLRQRQALLQKVHQTRVPR
jgi:23S rRNA (adenine-N6)-dimethyltransferase